MNAEQRAQENKERNRNAIIGAATDIFADKGYYNATMDDIASASGFTKRTVYQYFGDKQELYYAVSAEMFRRMMKSFRTDMTGDGGIESILDNFGISLFRFYQENRPRFKLLFSGFLNEGDSPSPCREQLLQYKNTALVSFGEVLKEGIRQGKIRKDLDVRQTVFSIQSLILGFLYMLNESGEGIEKRFGDKYENFVLNSIKLVTGSILTK